jgi:hypothetical protein
MSRNPVVYLSIYLSIYLFIYLSIYININIWTHAHMLSLYVAQTGLLFVGSRSSSASQLTIVFYHNKLSLVICNEIFTFCSTNIQQNFSAVKTLSSGFSFIIVPCFIHFVLCTLKFGTYWTVLED